MYKHSDPHLQLWRDEPVSVNDCILRNINQYKYIANIDNDEIIMPQEYSGWNEMLDHLGNETADMKVRLDKGFSFILTLVHKCFLQSLGAFCFFNAYFLEDMLETPFEDIPQDLYMMQHVYRSSYSEHAKCLFNTETVLTVQQHFIQQSCIVSGTCGFEYVHGSIG